MLQGTRAGHQRAGQRVRRKYASVGLRLSQQAQEGHRGKDSKPVCKRIPCSTPNAICCERGCPRTHAKMTILAPCCQSRRCVRTVTANLQDWTCSLPYGARAVAARAKTVVGLDVTRSVYHGLHLLLAGPAVILSIMSPRRCMHARLTNATGRCSCARARVCRSVTCLFKITTDSCGANRKLPVDV